MDVDFETTDFQQPRGSNSLVLEEVKPVDGAAGLTGAATNSGLCQHPARVKMLASQSHTVSRVIGQGPSIWWEVLDVYR